MNEPTLEEELYDMPQDEIDGLKERLAMMSRNMRAKGLETYRFQNYEMGEDLVHGTLSIDYLETKRVRTFGKGEHNAVVSRRVLLMIDREGNLMVPKRNRPMLRKLSESLILDELAAI